MFKFTMYPAVPYRASRVRSAAADKAPLVGMRHFVKWCLLCVLVFCSGSVFAAPAAPCSSTGGGNYVLDIGTVVIPENATIGSTVIPEKVTSGVPYAITCAPTDLTIGIFFFTTVSPVSGYTNVYPTSLAGLGVRYKFTTSDGQDCGPHSFIVSPTSGQLYYGIRCIPGSGGKSWSLQASTEFVKTGAIANGTITSIPTMTMGSMIGGYSTVSPMPSMYTGVATGSVIPPTCSTPDVVIPMGNVNFSTFNRAGVVNDKWNNATFRVDNCPAGLNRVTIKFDAPIAGWLDDTNGVFNLNSPTDAATAKGIGIQMSFGANNALAVYGSAQTLNGYDAYKTTGGSFTVPIGARYVKPASTLKLIAGQANGSVAFVMSYE